MLEKDWAVCMLSWSTLSEKCKLGMPDQYRTQVLHTLSPTCTRSRVESTWVEELHYFFLYGVLLMGNFGVSNCRNTPLERWRPRYVLTKSSKMIDFCLDRSISAIYMEESGGVTPPVHGLTKDHSVEMMISWPSSCLLWSWKCNHWVDKVSGV